MAFERIEIKSRENGTFLLSFLLEYYILKYYVRVRSLSEKCPNIWNIRSMARCCSNLTAILNKCYRTRVNICCLIAYTDSVNLMNSSDRGYGRLLVG